MRVPEYAKRDWRNLCAALRAHGDTRAYRMGWARLWDGLLYLQATYPDTDWPGDPTPAILFRARTAREFSEQCATAARVLWRARDLKAALPRGME